MSHIPQDAARRLVDRLGAAAPHGGPDSDLYSRLESLSKAMESSGRIDEHEHPDAYGAILDAMRFVAAAPSAPAPAEVPPHPEHYYVWTDAEKAAILAYAAAREAAERERLRGVLRELVEAYRSLINTLGHEDATAADEEKAEARFACAEAAARAELGGKA